MPVPGPCSELVQVWVGWRWLRTMRELPPVPWVKIAFPLRSRGLLQRHHTNSLSLEQLLLRGGGTRLAAAPPARGLGRRESCLGKGVCRLGVFRLELGSVGALAQL